MIFFILILVIIIYLSYLNRNKHSNFANTDNYYEFNNNTNHNVFNDEDMGKHGITNLIKSSKVWDITMDKIESNIKPTLTQDNINQLIYEKEQYTLLGRAINKYYNINYLIYESKTKYNDTNITIKDNPNYLHNPLYNYLLVSIIDNKQIIKHNINPREKININDTIYLAENTFQLGPLLILSY